MIAGCEVIQVFEDSFSAARVYPLRMFLAIGGLMLLSVILSRL